MSAEEVKKVMAVQWEEKEPYCMPHGYQYKLENVDNYLKEMDELLLEAGMEGLGYQSQAENIQKTALGMGLLNAYISTLMSEIDAQIDQPLYRGFQNEATEQLSRIRMEDYSTENTLGLKRHYKIHDAYGQIMEYDAQAVSLTMKDFLGLTSLDDNAGHGDLIGMPKEFSDFTNLFAVEYDKIKDNLKDETGKEVTLEEYLTYLNTKGEFDNKMDKPLQELISAILDVTIIKPLIEMCTGYDMITGEDLTDFERGLKGVFAVVDVVTLFIGIKASGVAKLFSREALETGGRIIATDMISNGTAYAVGKMGEELGLPLPITLMLSMGAGVTVSLTAGKYVFKDSAGNVVLEAGADEVDGIRTQIKQGVETGSDVLEGGTVPKGTLTGKLDGLTTAERTMVDDLLNAGNNVEIIPRSNIPGDKTPDFLVNGVKTELKTLTGTSLNTPVTRIQDGFKQGAEAVIIDGRNTGLTLDDANTVIERALGKYGGELPGIVEIWTTEGILRR